MPKLSINCYFLAALVSMGTLATSLKADAALINYNLIVNIDFGPLTGNVYTGSFTYDNDGLTGTGNESVFLTDFNFNFDGNPYTFADDPGATVSFFDGTFLGLDYAVVSPPSPTFISGSLDVSDALFTYDLGAPGTAGTGEITYQLVPEPSGWLALVIPGACLIRKRKNQSS
jgi:hypothetical protein